MKFSLFILSFLGLVATSTQALAENIREFEGRVIYSVDFELKNSGINKKDLYKYYGIQKEFFFKQGNYKWSTKKGKLEYEIFNIAYDSLHTYTKDSKNDTLFLYDFMNSTQKVLSVDSLETTSICGLNCQGIKFKINDDNNLQMTRTLYFPTDSLLYSKEYYVNQKMSCNNIVYGTGKSIPLKLMLDIKRAPFILIYTATSIVHEPLDDKVFSIEESRPRKLASR